MPPINMGFDLRRDHGFRNPPVLPPFMSLPGEDRAMLEGAIHIVRMRIGCSVHCDCGPFKQASWAEVVALLRLRCS